MTWALERLCPTCDCGALLPWDDARPKTEPVAVRCVACHAIVTARFYCRQRPEPEMRARTPCRVHKGFIEDCGCRP